MRYVLTVLLLPAAALWLTACDGARLETPSQAVPANDAPTATPATEPAMIHVHLFNTEGQLVGPIQTPLVVMTEEEWQSRLTPEQYRIVRKAGTERPFCGTLLDNKQEGVYTCVACGLPLFASDSKFKSGTGWPSFFRPIAPTNIAEKSDHSHGMIRTEINCARCDGHLGHVFDDGPRPTGLRYCLNSESLAFTHRDELHTLAEDETR